jgi:hypothetical protein
VKISQGKKSPILLGLAAARRSARIAVSFAEQSRPLQLEHQLRENKTDCENLRENLTVKI